MWTVFINSALTVMAAVELAPSSFPLNLFEKDSRLNLHLVNVKSLPLLLNNGVQIHFFFAHVVFLVQVFAVAVRVIDFKFDLQRKTCI